MENMEQRKVSCKMASIRDVAVRAGVGIGTVSRTINKSGYVSEETRKKILEAVEATGYKPSEIAKNMIRKRTGIIGVMVPDQEHPFFAKIMKHMENELYKQGYKCLACNTLDIVNRQKSFIEMLDSRAVDGIISCVDELPDFSRKNGRAIVSFDRASRAGVPVVRSDHELGGRLAAEVFIKKGCKKVCQFTAGIDRVRTANIRHEVMKQVLEEAGVEVVSIITAWDALSYSYNKEMVHKYWDIIETVDGIMTTDIGALSCLAVAKKMGISIPDDLCIIAYDGTDIAELTYPELTVIQQDCMAIAKKCVETVLKMIDGERVEDLEKIPVKLIERGTT